MREVDLYEPVKSLLQDQGYEVKGEIVDCDVVAVRGDEPPVIVELKTSFSLDLVLQGIARQSITEDVYLAVGKIAGGRKRRQNVLSLCRRLGVGLMTVRLEPKPFVDVLLDPAAYRPRARRKSAGRLLREFRHRVGDNARGGSAKRPLMTAYRQDALRLVLVLEECGPTKASIAASRAGVPNAGTILRRDVYGWFERAERGVYRLTPKGETATTTWADAVDALKSQH
ncbi:MAG: DUF2161 family putative PD-(D/E)XK-type phosphodiesterase [Pseudomonadota bacterium]